MCGDKNVVHLHSALDRMLFDQCSTIMRYISPHTRTAHTTVSNSFAHTSTGWCASLTLRSDCCSTNRANSIANIFYTIKHSRIHGKFLAWKQKKQYNPFAIKRRKKRNERTKKNQLAYACAPVSVGISYFLVFVFSPFLSIFFLFSSFAMHSTRFPFTKNTP